MIRYYLLPIERIDDAGTIRRGPAYFDFRGHIEPGHVQVDNAAGEAWSMKDMGSVDMAVFAFNAAEAKHTDLAGRGPDVYQFPENLDVTLSAAQRTALNTYLEAHNIPGDWLAPSDTWRQNLRIITAMFLYLQRTLAIIGYPQNPFAGISLNTRYNQIANPLYDAMSQAATDLGYAWGVTANTQVRRIFKLMADQWGARPIGFGFIDL